MSNYSIGGRGSSYSYQALNQRKSNNNQNYFRKNTYSNNRDRNQSQNLFNDKKINEQMQRLLDRCCEKLNTYQQTDKPKANEYRDFDGSNNNLTKTSMGELNSTSMHMIPTDEDRQIGGATEVDLANPRTISNEVMAQTEDTENKKGLSDMFWLWGQFLDHDITLTQEDEHSRADISMPAGDEWFDPTWSGTETMGFKRTETTTGADGKSTYNNSITAYIDGSNVYGSDQETADSLRSFEGGRLISSADNLLPEDENGHFLAGDVRVNENVALTSMHTIWMREHNRIADELSAENPRWGDEKIYQEARKEVIAEMQAITYNEFVPNLLGKDTLSSYQGYDSDTSAQITNSFATAAYRLGHTMISPTIQRLDENGEEIAEGNLDLRNAFFSPDKVKEAGIDPILRGMASQTAQAVDPMLIDDLRNFLFGPPGAGGFDLASLNIQRGRDHELSGLNDSREALGLSRIESFDDPIWKDGYGEKLAAVYDSPDDVDLWVGGLAENEDGDSMVGETFTHILADQFERLRTGDRFWYENQFSKKEVNEFNNLKLSDVIERNTGITNLQDNVMVAQPIVADSTEQTESSSVSSASTSATIIRESFSNQNIRAFDDNFNIFNNRFGSRFGR